MIKGRGKIHWDKGRGAEQAKESTQKEIVEGRGREEEGVMSS